ncbi:MAG: hypothetical protein AAF585_13910 [Verrucomicrobiota bacterium]
MKSLPILLLALVAVFTFAPRAQAQISVQMQAEKKIYVAYEPLNMIVAITNRAGRDVVLSGPSGDSGSWLSFEVTDDKGYLISPKRAINFEPVIIPAGQTLQRKIPINRAYPMARKGEYRIKSNVYFPQLRKYFNSREQRIQVSDGREIWNQVVGVPQGREGEGTYRRYSMMTFSNGAKKELYLRIKQEENSAVRATYSLGPIITVRSPEFTIDKENRLHCLHMAAPRTYAHTVIDVDGVVVNREVYREDVNRPKLAAAGVGDVVVVGGVSEKEDAASPIDADIRRLSERPKGMPRVDRTTGMPRR